MPCGEHSADSPEKMPVDFTDVSFNRAELSTILMKRYETRKL